MYLIIMFVSISSVNNINYIYVVVKLLLCLYALPNGLYIKFSYFMGYGLYFINYICIYVVVHTQDF